MNLWAQNCPMAAVLRVRKRKEEKLKEQELKLREKLKEEAKNGSQAAG